MEKLVLEKMNKIVVPLFGAAFVLCLVSFHVFVACPLSGIQSECQTVGF